MKLEVVDEKLVLKASAVWARVLGIWILVIGLVAFLYFLVEGGFAQIVGLVVGVIFTGVGLIFAMQPDKLTEFDLRSREVTVWQRWPLWKVRSVTTAFAEIDRIGLVMTRDAETGLSHSVELVRRDGTRFNLAVLNGSGATFGNLLSVIAEATGIARLDRESHPTDTWRRPRPPWKS